MTNSVFIQQKYLSSLILADFQINPWSPKWSPFYHSVFTGLPPHRHLAASNRLSLECISGESLFIFLIFFFRQGFFVLELTLASNSEIYLSLSPQCSDKRCVPPLPSPGEIILCGSLWLLQYSQRSGHLFEIISTLRAENSTRLKEF